MDKHPRPFRSASVVTEVSKPAETRNDQLRLNNISSQHSVIATQTNAVSDSASCSLSTSLNFSGPHAKSGTSIWTWKTDSQFRFTELSQNFQRTTNIAPECLLGKPIFDVLFQTDSNQSATDTQTQFSKNWLKSVLQRNESFLNQCIYVTQSNQMHCCRISGNPIFDTESTDIAIGYEGNGYDSTAFDAQLDQLRLLADSVEGANEGLVIFDQSGNLIYSNNSSASILGIPKHAVFYGIPISRFLLHIRKNSGFEQFNPPDPAWIESTRKNIISGLWSTVFQLRLNYWVELSSELSRNGNIIVRVRDISSFRKKVKHKNPVQQNFRELATATADWFWQTDAQGKFVWSSCHSSELFLKDLSEVIFGKTHQCFLNREACISGYRKLEENMMAKRFFRNIELAYHHQNNQRWIRISGMPQFDKNKIFTGYFGIGTDIDEIKNAALITETTRKRMYQALGSVLGAVALFDEHDRLVYFNDEFRELNINISSSLKTGLSFEDYYIKLLASDCIYEAIGKERSFMQKRMERHRNCSERFTEQRKPDTWIEIRERRLDNGSTILYAHDVSDQKTHEVKLYNERNLLRTVLSSIPDHIYAVDQNLQIIVANQSAIEDYTLTKTGNVIGKNLEDCHGLIDHDDLEVLRSGHAIRDKEVQEADPKKGELRHKLVSKHPLRNKDGNVIGLVAHSRDLTRLHKLTSQLSYLATHDELTQLLNRRGFTDAVKKALYNFQVKSTPCTVCFLDLDQFKIVNDTVGHTAGDELLQQIAQLFKSMLEPDTVLARLGGDEFGIVFCNRTLSAIEVILDKIRTTMVRFRFEFDEKVFTPGVSIGVAEVTEDCCELEEILARADMACYSAKDVGRGSYHIYSKDSLISTERSTEMHKISDIRAALDENRFFLHWQPIINSPSSQGNETHYEVLLRMRDPSGATVMPGTFIPAAERYKLMNLVDRHVVNEALFTYSSTYQEEASTRISINLSAQSLSDPTLPGYIREKLKFHGIEPQQICFEITETTLITNMSVAKNLIRDLKTLGVKFSLDDFGSGLSSFEYLKHFDLDYLKIDGQYVRSMLSSPTDHAMVEAIHKIGKTMGLKTIAEFVETQAHMDALVSLGVDYLQGYFIGEPAAID